jgi:hypothetical protein
MKTRVAWLGLVGLLLIAASAGCKGAETTDTDPMDAGADAPVVILDGGGDPAVPPNGASLCPAGACNYQTKEGCAAGQSCVPSPDGMGKATPTCAAAGTGLSGAACKGNTECAGGYLCTSPTDGVCRKLCCGGDWTGCPSDDEHCIQNVAIKDQTGVFNSGAMLCLPVNNCDALEPSSCGVAGQACQIVDATGATACFNEGTGDSGQPCPCKGGFLCVKDACRRLCKAVEGGGEPSCKEGEGICVHYVRDPEGVGECTPQSDK